jgi:hypothetical protein
MARVSVCVRVKLDLPPPHGLETDIPTTALSHHNSQIEQPNAVVTVEKGAHVPFHPTLADVSDQTKRAFSAVAANAIASKLEAKAKPMEFQAKLEAAAQLALEAEAHEARKKLNKKKKKKKKKKRKRSSSDDSDSSSSEEVRKSKKSKKESKDKKTKKSSKKKSKRSSGSSSSSS